MPLIGLAKKVRKKNVEHLSYLIGGCFLRRKGHFFPNYVPSTLVSLSAASIHASKGESQMSHEVKASIITRGWRVIEVVPLIKSRRLGDILKFKRNSECFHNLFIYFLHDRKHINELFG